MRRGEPIHVAHVIGSTGMYGAERWILAQLRYLDPTRTRISIVNLVDSAEARSDFVAEARRSGHDAVDFYTGGRFNPRGPLRLARLARQNGYDILHSHGYKSDLVALAAARLARIKVIATPHGWAKENDRKLLLYEKVDRRVLRVFDHVCPLSSALYDDLIVAGVRPTTMTLVENGVDLEEIDAAPRKPRMEKKRIGYLGQLIERKGLDDLIQAFFFLQRDDCELFLVGDGPLRRRLQERVASEKSGKEIHFLGYSPDRLEDLKSFDVLVLASLKEGIPRCLMEAHAAKVPVVATDIDGIRSIVIHEKSGLLVPPGDPPALAHAISRLLDAPQLAAALASNGRKLVEDKFSAKKMAQRYELLYRSIGGSRDTICAT